MRLAAEIYLEVEVEDFVSAADHQRRIEAMVETFRAAYPGAQLTIRERRRRRPPVRAAAPRFTPPTGAVNGYRDT